MTTKLVDMTTTALNKPYLPPVQNSLRQEDQVRNQVRRQDIHDSNRKVKREKREIKKINEKTKE